MKVEFKNIGVIDHSTIDLAKDLTIFCGPNNTGKTFLANSIYALYKLDELSLRPVPIEITNQLSKGLFEGHATLQLDNDFVKEILKSRSEDALSFLPSVFATNKNFFSNSMINLIVTDTEISQTTIDLQMNGGINLGNIGVRYSKAKGDREIKFLFTEEIKEAQPVYLSNGTFIINILISRIQNNIIKGFFQKAYITPAERTAINIFSKELSVKRNEIVDRLLEYKTDNSQQNFLDKVQRYPLPIRDSLEIAEDLSNLQKASSEYSFLAEQIETEILKGQINVSSSGDVVFTPANTKIKNLNIHLSASVVKSLSNLVFYFRHLARKNDFIIIDEPELNLHPDNQIIIAKLIGRFVNSGFKVLISTHSDYIIKELNNLIRLRSADDHSISIMHKYNYDPDNLLDHNKIGVYLFKDRKTKAIPVNELGFEISTIEKENSTLSEISESIYFQLFDKSE